MTIEENKARMCTHEDMHPYNCLPIACCHCNLLKDAEHDPDNCLFCYADEQDGLRPLIAKNLEEEKLRISL